MPDFNAKMHQNRFRLGLSLGPRPLAEFKGSTSKGSGGEGRSTCLPPRFDNPGYGPGPRILTRDLFAVAKHLVFLLHLRNERLYSLI